MSWICTMFIGGMLLSMGWRLGAVVYEYLKDFVLDAPEGIRKIRRYQRRKQQRYIEANRRRRLESR